jgi:ATP-binding cassette subfamily F protein 3
VLVISHDRHLIEATVDQIWIAQDGTIKPYEEDIEAYQRMLVGGAQRSQGKGNSSEAGGAAERKKERQASAAKRAELAPLRKQIINAEKKLSRLKVELEKIEAQLADPALYADNSKADMIVDLGKEKARLEGEVDVQEGKWLAKTEELELAEAAQE